jgi:hypothetical protein
MSTLEQIIGARDLFSTDQLEQWKDELAVWWGQEKLRNEHKKVSEIFRRYFKVSKKEAIEMEFNSRDDPEAFIEYFLGMVIRNFRWKLEKKKVISELRVTMSCQYGAFAKVEFPAGSGEIQDFDVDGHVGIVGRVFYEDGTIQSIFQRFISHPFWQYSNRSSN